MASKARTRTSGRSGRRGLVLAGGSKAKLRKPQKRNWTKAKEEIFLRVLSETCNVTEACRQAKVSLSGAYLHRKTKAAFRAAWGEAIAVAYRRLELVLLERAFNGCDKTFTRKDGGEEKVREYPNAIALQLLKMHKATTEEAERDYPPAEVDEMREKLRRKLERLRQRMIDDGTVKL